MKIDQTLSRVRTYVGNIQILSRTVTAQCCTEDSSLLREEKKSSYIRNFHTFFKEIRI